MIYLLHGEEEFLVSEALAQLKAGFGSGDMLDLNTIRFEGGSVGFAEFEAAVCTIPFLADCRLVLVDGLLASLQRRAAHRGDGDEGEGDGDGSETAGGRADGGWEKLGDLLTRLPDTTQLVFIEGAINARATAAKAVMQAADVRRFDKLKGPPLADWVRKRAVEHACKLSGGALPLLVNLAGNDLRLLDSELQKLTLYANGASVDEAAVRALVPLSAETAIFGLVDAFVERQLTPAQRELHRLLNNGAAPPYLLFMLARQVRLVLAAADLLSERLPQSEMGPRLGLAGFPLTKTIEQAQRTNVPTLIAMLNRLLEADVQMKTGKLDAVLAVELLVTELCIASRARAGR
ncbi:MAG: DNA polymerase III subunit delta [Dehalococcoidia bacterium]|nr:DNA polymerase III subunit delta [Dehalococcoidia bacterium]